MAHRRPGTTRQTTHYEDRVIDAIELKQLLMTLLKRKGTRSILAAYASLKTKKRWREAREKLVPLADVVLLHKALFGRTDHAQVRAAELLLLYAGEKPAEEVKHSGTMSLAELAIEGYEYVKRNGRHKAQTSAVGADNGDGDR